MRWRSAPAGGGSALAVFVGFKLRLQGGKFREGRIWIGLAFALPLGLLVALEILAARRAAFGAFPRLAMPLATTMVFVARVMAAMLIGLALGRCLRGGIR
jgi:hypothetical protein